METQDRGESLRERRRASGLTVAQLAGMADVSASTIERIEQGVRPHRSEALRRMYSVLDARAVRLETTSAEVTP